MKTPGGLAIIVGGMGFVAACAILFLYLAPLQLLAQAPAFVPDPGHRLNVQTLGGSRVTMRVEPGDMQRALQVFRLRALALGAREPVVKQIGPDQVMVEAPGYTDANLLGATMAASAHLTFRFDDEAVTAQDVNAGRIPPGDVLAPAPGCAPLCAFRSPFFDGSHLIAANPFFDAAGRPDIAIRVDAAGAKLLREATQTNVGKRFGIFLDDRLLSAPVITGTVTDQMEITGQYTEAEAASLALALNSGPLSGPAQVLSADVVSAAR